VGILESALEVSLQAGNQSQALLFRTAIDRINEVLGPTEGEQAIQKAAGQDNSPEATATRILAFTTGLYTAYAANHPDASQEQNAQDFVKLVRGGFEKGFNEAKDILQGLKVYEGDVATGIQKTYDLVQKGFDDFLATMIKPAEDTNKADKADKQEKTAQAENTAPVGRTSASIAQTKAV